MSNFLYLNDFCNACYHGLSKSEVRIFYCGKLVQDICIQYNKLLDIFCPPYKHDFITYENSCKNFKILISIIVQSYMKINSLWPNKFNFRNGKVASVELYLHT